MTQNLTTNTVAVNRNLLLQALSYLQQHPDPMARMLIEQFRFALCQEDLPASQQEKP